MRKYTAKNEEELIKQIENDTELDKEWGKSVKGHVDEIKHVDDTDFHSAKNTKKPVTASA